MQAVRLDSGDLAVLSKEVRQVLDAAGWRDVQIVASGDLNEHKIESLLAAGAPIDIFGVGTELVTSRDDPSLNTVYKLVEQQTQHGPVGRFKLSRDKKTYPYAKQVWRQRGPDGNFVKDVIGRANETLPGETLLVPVLRAGQLVRPLPTLDNSRARCVAQLNRLPKELRSLKRASAFSVQVSDHLESELRLLTSAPT